MPCLLEAQCATLQGHMTPSAPLQWQPEHVTRFPDACGWGQQGSSTWCSHLMHSPQPHAVPKSRCCSLRGCRSHQDRFSIPFVPLGCPARHTGKIPWCVGRAWDWRTRFPETSINLVLRSLDLLPRKAHIGLIWEEALPASGQGGGQAGNNLAGKFIETLLP